MSDLDNAPKDGDEEKEINLDDDFFMDDGVSGDHHEDMYSFGEESSEEDEDL